MLFVVWVVVVSDVEVVVFAVVAVVVVVVVHVVYGLVKIRSVTAEILLTLNFCGGGRLCWLSLI